MANEKNLDPGLFKGNGSNNRQARVSKLLHGNEVPGVPIRSTVGHFEIDVLLSLTT